MSKKKKELKYKVILNPNMQVTDDDICRLLFGINKEQLIKEISDNKGGKYDELYDEEAIA